ncbi:MAG: ribosome biogenesis GTPase Der [Candidatus Komeilibacteria bacterium RIFOXYC1_FULL_37_11]|uniref:GTPase Der n=1 Tax=Candidatus Komeilibacteria bacterium RIFOXYC1_FULL_37_11 TaxID=1798555 RepID=A0A1G2C0N8_9BACT|nr:MAG: ribosome biogenesis GTPase Der [Candidatus Komeilibacteria bacterium RIFOXYC1_FULL_37_11]OGY95303.1 MAG: ribosome biogenesis GTPase Der [Candidatus Komeilibacteria bacterium RIFOXYD1_FULL_37_29]
MPSLYKVAIVGRVNVGKSTLFNRLISDPKAITSHVAGTTRDRNYATCSWKDMDFSLIDTGGLERQSDDEIDRQIIEQAQTAISEADLLLFVVDVRNGIMATDMELAKNFKRNKQPVLLVVNKTDNNKTRQYLAEFYKLNLGHPWPVSAINGVGTGDLLDEVVVQLKKIKNKKRLKETTTNEKAIRVAVVGKPNVGKSSIINAILGEQRVIVSSIAHTTRDAQDIEFMFEGQKIIFVDTAGIRRQSKKTADPFEKQSIDQSIDTIKKADIAILVTDVFSKLTWQDKHLIEHAENAGVGLIILANKWDLIPDKTTDTVKEFENYYKSFFPFLRWAPIIFSSATRKMRIKKILDSVLSIYQEKNKTITENALDKLLKNLVKRHKPSRGKGTKYPYIYSLKQLHTNPPVFAIKIDFKADLHDSYLRFIENNLRYKFGFEGTPIHIRVIKTQNLQDK